MLDRPIRPATLVAVAFLLVLGSSAAIAQTHPNHAQGFEPQKVFEVGDVEAVNLFNGNLNLSLPLGPRYPVSEALSYGLTLSYSGNVWEWEEESLLGPNGYEYFLKAIPRKRSNAGLGWRLTLGEINPPQSLVNGAGGTFYETPDGNLHELEINLHADGSQTPGYLYSQDGTYLRYNTTSRVLEFPDGTRQTFNASGDLTSILDRFGNTVTVTYLSSPTRWVIADPHGRTQTVYFKSAAYYGSVVDKVVVSAFGGTTATYTFQYTEANVVRGWTNLYVINQNLVPRTILLPLLTGIAQPDGSTWSMPVADYDLGPASSTSTLSGHLQAMTLPTGGRMEWDWTLWYFPQESARRVPLRYGGATLDPANPFRLAAGLSQRRHKDLGGTLLGTWTYSQQMDVDLRKKEQLVTVTDPLGHPTTYYFSVYQNDDDPTTPEPSGWYEQEYGLPFTHKVSDGTNPGRWLSAEIKKSGGTMLRKVYVRYERDGLTKANPRLASERTVYVDDAGTYADTTSSDFDGLGHYRQTTTGGNFAAGNVRSTYTAFNPGACATCTPATSSPWLLETFTDRTVTEGGVTAKTESCFEAGTGYLLRARTLKSGTVASASDVVARFTRNTQGNTTVEELFGGDTQSLGTGALCSLALPTAQVRTDHTYQVGVRKSSQISGAPFKSLDLDLDAKTGLPSASRDVAGLSTSFVYDTMGRLTDVKPQSGHDGWTQYSYWNASGTTQAQIYVKRKTNGGATVLAESRMKFDGLGRLAKEETLMPDGTWVTRETKYNGAGAVSSVSSTGATSNKTQYLSYDPFGRPGTIRPPDGSAHDVTLTYQGVRQVQRKVKVGTAWSGTAVTETQATTTEIYDRQGRLYQLLEPANPDGTVTTTTYGYDVGGRLASVTQKGKNGTTTYTQTRTFTYDNRGFLTAEKHPEKGASGNGWVSYFSYDARGLPGRILDGPNDLAYLYDAAGRVIQVKENGTGGRLLKTFTYATANGTSDWKKGKLVTSSRYNYPVLGTTTYTAQVNQAYTYGGRQGRVSARQTSLTFNGTTSEYFNQTWVWNDLGDLASQTYPQCSFSPCTTPTPRTVTYGYTRAFLTSVPGYAAAISYHPNGTVYQVTHVNDPANPSVQVVDTVTKDPYSIARPNKIDAKLGTTVVWSSGVYSYDGAGNLTKAGNAYYLYDPVSRVKSGLLYTGAGAGGSTVTFSHTFDGFGNLTAITTGTTRSIPVTSSTNRLSSPSTYDAAGNLTSWNGNTYQYDHFDQAVRTASGSEIWLHMYDADDERIWSYKEGANPRIDRWTLRDLDGRVLRTYDVTGYTSWAVGRDYVYRGRQLLAAHTADASPKDRIQFHLDHLGTPRAITDKSGTRIAYHLYYPFGEEATAVAQDAERMKLTGHERDLGVTTSAADDLDYMHARYFNAQIGRFSSFDPLGGSEFSPQTWNRYSYVLGNPLKFVDPSGMAEIDSCSTSGSDEERVQCRGSVEVIAKDPGRTYDPLTGVQGVASLVSGSTAMLQLSGGLRSGPAGGNNEFRLSFSERVLSAIPSGFAQTTGEALVGFGDTVSFGLTDWYRSEAGLDNTINEDSGAYLVGQVAGVAHEVALGGVGAARVAGVQTKIAIHGAHHAFARLGGRRLAHIQLNVWRAGVKGSGRAFRIALPWR